ncbi:MAG: lptD [Deltaproteobacteria bacterium]|nr:lptD [Deltaproteobacteria bacterium]
MKFPWLDRKQAKRPSAITLLPFFLALLLTGFAADSDGQQVQVLKFDSVREPVRIQANEVSYDHKEEVYTAEGKVEIFQGDRKLSADRVTLSGKSNEVEATGNVILVQGEDVLRSERMKINLDTSLGIIVRGTLFLKKQHFYLRGEEIERIGEETFRIRKGSLTTCDGDWPAWRFTSREVVVTLEEYASIYGAKFEIKNVPVLYSPYLIFPVKTQRQSGFLIPRLTYSNLSGVEFNTAYYWAIAKNMDATVYLDLTSKKGIGEGLEYRYVRKEDSSGKFYAYHLRELESYREKRTDQLDRKPDRWEVDFQHEEYFDSSFFAKTRLRSLSDRQFLKDYGATYEDRSSEQAFSFVSLTKNWESTSLFGEARHSVDLRQEDKTTLQNYPVVNFTGLRKQLGGSPFYYSFHSAYGNFWREEGVSGNQADLHPRLSMPLRWGFLEVTPEAGVRETLYSVHNGDQDTHSRESWDFRTAAAAEMFRVFDTGSTTVPKLKHIIRPEISYSYLPDTNQHLIPFPYLSYYDPTMPKGNAITVAISQRLIGKISEGPGKSRYQELAYFKLSQTYDISEANRDLVPGSQPRRPFGAVTGELRGYWLQYVTAENITTYDPSRNRFLNSYSLISLSDGRGDSLTVEYSWIDGVQDQINAWLRVRLHPSLDAIYGKRYSRREKQSLETSYGIQYRHQCWTVDLTYLETPDIAGTPAEKKFLLQLNLMGVTSIGKR